MSEENMFKVPSISTILTVADAMEPREAKIEVLRRCQSEALLSILQGAMDKRIVLNLPRGDLEYTPMPTGEGDGHLHKQYKQLVYCAAMDLPFAKRLQIFIGVLEMIAPTDARMLIDMKDKKLPWRTITPDLVIEAFPTLDLVPVDNWGVEVETPSAPFQDSGRVPSGSDASKAQDGTTPAEASVPSVGPVKAAVKKPAAKRKPAAKKKAPAKKAVPA
jgi:hypothetical protein